MTFILIIKRIKYILPIIFVVTAVIVYDSSLLPLLVFRQEKVAPMLWISIALFCNKVKKFCFLGRTFVLLWWLFVLYAILLVTNATLRRLVPSEIMKTFLWIQQIQFGYRNTLQKSVQTNNDGMENFFHLTSVLALIYFYYRSHSKVQIKIIANMDVTSFDARKKNSQKRNFPE